MAEPCINPEPYALAPGAGLLEERVAPRAGLPPLLVPLADRLPEALQWLGASFGLTQPLFNFWSRAGYAPVYLRQTASDITGAPQDVSEALFSTCDKNADVRTTGHIALHSRNAESSQMLRVTLAREASLVATRVLGRHAKSRHALLVGGTAMTCVVLAAMPQASTRRSCCAPCARARWPVPRGWSPSRRTSARGCLRCSPAPSGSASSRGVTCPS